MFRIKLNMELPGVIPDTYIKLISPLHIVWNRDHCDMIINDFVVYKITNYIK